VPGAAGQFNQMYQSSRANVPAGGLSTEPPDDFVQSGLMNTGRQIAEIIELGQWH
jgi:hypothetical protein